LLLVRSHQAKLIAAKGLIQGRNNNTMRVGVEPRSCDRRRNRIGHDTEISTVYYMYRTRSDNLFAFLLTY